MSSRLKSRPPSASYTNGGRFFYWAEDFTAAILFSELDVAATRRQLCAGYLRLLFAFGTSVPQLTTGTPWIWIGLGNGEVHVGRLVDRRKPAIEPVGVLDARDVRIERVLSRYVAVRLGSQLVTVKKKEARILLWWLERQ